VQATSPAGDGESCIGEWARNGHECIGCIS
jgi:hypothetical protein